MFKKKIIVLWQILMFASVFVGCTNTPVQKTPEQLFGEYSSGVVLIYCEYYYSLTLPTGMRMYMTGISDAGEVENVTTNENIIKQNCNRQFGTGFFIDSKGDIMTNRHVVNVSLDENNAKQQIVASLRRKCQAYIDSMELAKQAYVELQEQKNECYNYDYYGNIYTDDEKIQQINELMSVVELRYNEWKQLCDFIYANSDSRGIRIETISRIGIAYNNTRINSFNDFLGANSCVVRKISRRDNADLAIIQLNSRKTPELSYIFDITGMASTDKATSSIFDYFQRMIFGQRANSRGEAEKLKINQQLYMIGYNHGISIAQTRDGIKAQMTGGKITQLPDGERLLYSIPTMQGSSGSPLFDEEGTFRGVNFAKATLNDDFNFGIPINLIKNFLEE